MKLPYKQLTEILDGMEKMLKPATEETEKVIKAKGGKLLSMGIDHIKKGGILVRVDPDGDYLYSQTVRVKINHRSRMKTIIESAKDMDEMQEALAAYLVKYAKAKDAITKGIPSHLRISKN